MKKTGLNIGFRICFKPVFLFILITLVFISAVPDSAFAQPPVGNVPLINLNLGSEPGSGRMAAALQIFLLLTVISLAPAILVMLTSFTRIAIVLSILRQAIGTQQTPPNQVIIGISLFLTCFIMKPVWQEIDQHALTPYLEKKIDQKVAFENGLKPIRAFMFRQTREKELALFLEIAHLKRPGNQNDVPTFVLIPAFMVSELKTAFQIAFLLYMPFLIIDMIVASVLLSMGMMMLPPVMISLPFKIMLFVLADGWYLIVGSLVKSFS